MQKYNAKNASLIHAFSLVELAVVIALLAFVVGGVITGKNLLFTAGLREIPTQAHQYISAIESFRDKYGALPGDMVNAQEIWGRADGGAVTTDCGNPATDTSATSITATCNGNGDGVISRNNGIGTRAFPERYEAFRIWQHLKNADMIKGAFSGVAGTAGLDQTVGGVNTPASFLKASAYDIEFFDVTRWGHFTEPDYRHVLYFGKHTSWSYAPHLPILSPRNMYEMDKKLDDALPGSGTILSLNNSQSPNCVTTNVASTSVYKYETENDAPQCVALFITGF